MMLNLKTLRDVETVDRRVLGAIRLVDQPTGAPLVVPGAITARSAAIVDVSPPGAPTVVQEIALGHDALDIRPNRRGWVVIFRAPLFDAYTDAFLEPANPPELPADRRLRLRLEIADAGPNHLPRFFDVLPPHSLDPRAGKNIFIPASIALLRAPSATIPAGWSALRVRVRESATQATLPGVLIRVFRRPHAVDAEPLGIGLTEWRDEHTRGEAVVPIPGLLRFAPGAGANVLETTHTIELEATRHQNFPDPAADTPPFEQLPDVEALMTGTGATVVRRVSPPGAPALDMNPPGPLALSAGEALTVDLTMP